MKYVDRRVIDVSKFIEKKNGLSYVSWASAADLLMLADETASWEYLEPRMYGNDTMMVFCRVTAFGKSMTAQLPVMDHRNKAIANPDAFSVNTAMQRCLAKGIALHGIGLHVYQGEDVPPSLPEVDQPEAPKPKPPQSIVGKKGEWQIKVSIAQDSPEWLDAVDTVVSATLVMAESADDLLQIFRKNKQLFDAVKAHDPVFFKGMMEDFSRTKAQLEV